MAQLLKVQFSDEKVFDGTSQKTGKPYSKHLFVGPDGKDFVTFNSGVATAARAGLAGPITILFDEEQNGQYTNRTIREVVDEPQSENVTPITSAPTVAAEPKAPEGGTTPRQYLDQRETRILRQSALSRAIAAFEAAGLNPVTDSEALLELAEEYKSYFENGLS